MNESRIKGVKDYLFPVSNGDSSVFRPVPGSPDIKKNLGNYITPVQFTRLRHDIQMWRDAIKETELPYYPQRVRMQRMYQDTILNGHVFACLEKRKSLTLLRDFKICNDKGVESEDLKQLFRNSSSTADLGSKSTNWFDDFIRYTLESIDFGYSLISLGDLVNGSFPNLTPIKRWNVSPDRYNVSSYEYSISGFKFLEDPYRKWHIYVPTPSDLGVSPCGYGLLFKIAYYELLLRDNMGYNADFNEMFNQPFRVGKTTKTDPLERDSFEASLKNSGQLGYILLDEATDNIEFVESSSVGASSQSYGDFDKRLEQKISKIVLGHTDALDSTPGKLGGDQGGEKSPAQISMNNIQGIDGILVQNVVNTKLIPRMREMGFDIPIDYHFEYKNDSEIEEIRRNEDTSNGVVADIAYKMSQSGLKMTPEYFTERTKIPCTEIETKQKKNDSNATT